MIDQNNARRRTAARTLTCAALLSLSTVSGAQEFPLRPIKLLLPYAPGGSSDLASRLAAQYMGPVLGQSVLVENKPGGGGVPAIAELMRAAPDGHTIFGAEAGQWAILPAARADLPYNFLRDFAPIGLVYTAQQAIVVRDSVPARNLQELIALARAKPGSLQYGSPQIGGLHHLIMESFKAALGLNMGHVPYKGSGDSVQALLRGDVPIIMSGITAVAPYMKTGQVRLLAVASQTRALQAPEVPTIIEAAGLTGFHFAGQLGLVAPIATPRPVIDKLSAALRKGALHPDAVARAAVTGVDMTPSTPEVLAEVIREDIRKYTAAVKVSGLVP